ncbi:LapA family protein [Proteus myxofaciens]|uniref:Lipopolysaccharide assembly protein A n=1 Tax=Proteus myxofaciens ATCC 19692 TaxID=1354337 RepID=A0A198F8V1_9GAMM|nr:LapA family protein [Proteus myxofaciens]OAT20731.1 inner membrane protein [Proteus myxofaciens ATCC 19692]
MKKVLIFILVILVLAIVIIAMTLGSSNDQVVTFNYLIAQGEYRISTLLAILFGVGFILGWVVSGAFYLRVRLSLARANRKIKRLESTQNSQESQENRPTTVSVTK